MTAKAFITAAIALGIITTSCGDDPEPLSKAEFIEQADAICAETNELVAPIFEPMWDRVDEAFESRAQVAIFVELSEAIDEAMPHFDRQLEQLRGLDPPSDDGQLIEDLLDDHEAAMAEGVELFEAAAAGDQSAMATLDTDDPVAEVERRVRAYGMTVCGGDA